MLHRFRQIDVRLPQTSVFSLVKSLPSINDFLLLKLTNDNTAVWGQSQVDLAKSVQYSLLSDFKSMLRDLRGVKSWRTRPGS